MKWLKLLWIPAIPVCLLLLVLIINGLIIFNKPVIDKELTKALKAKQVTVESILFYPMDCVVIKGVRLEIDDRNSLLVDRIDIRLDWIGLITGGILRAVRAIDIDEVAVLGGLPEFIRYLDSIGAFKVAQSPVETKIAISNITLQLGIASGIASEVAVRDCKVGLTHDTVDVTTRIALELTDSNRNNLLSGDASLRFAIHDVLGQKSEGEVRLGSMRVMGATVLENQNLSIAMNLPQSGDKSQNTFVSEGSSTSLHLRLPLSVSQGTNEIFRRIKDIFSASRFLLTADLTIQSNDLKAFAILEDNEGGNPVLWRTNLLATDNLHPMLYAQAKWNGKSAIPSGLISARNIPGLPSMPVDADIRCVSQSNSITLSAERLDAGSIRLGGFAFRITMQTNGGVKIDSGKPSQWLKLDGRIEGSAIDLQAQIRDLRLSAISAILPSGADFLSRGSINANLRLFQTKSNPTLSASFDAGFGNGFKAGAQLIWKDSHWSVPTFYAEAFQMKLDGSAEAEFSSNRISAQLNAMLVKDGTNLIPVNVSVAGSSLSNLWAYGSFDGGVTFSARYNKPAIYVDVSALNYSMARWGVDAILHFRAKTKFSQYRLPEYIDLVVGANGFVWNGKALLHLNDPDSSANCYGYLQTPDSDSVPLTLSAEWNTRGLTSFKLDADDAIKLDAHTSNRRWNIKLTADRYPLERLGLEGYLSADVESIASESGEYGDKLRTSILYNEMQLDGEAQLFTDAAAPEARFSGVIDTGNRQKHRIDADLRLGESVRSSITLDKLATLSLNYHGTNAVVKLTSDGYPLERFGLIGQLRGTLQANLGENWTLKQIDATLGWNQIRYKGSITLDIYSGLQAVNVKGNMKIQDSDEVPVQLEVWYSDISNLIAKVNFDDGVRVDLSYTNRFISAVLEAQNYSLAKFGIDGNFNARIVSGFYDYSKYQSYTVFVEWGGFGLSGEMNAESTETATVIRWKGSGKLGDNYAIPMDAQAVFEEGKAIVAKANIDDAIRMKMMLDNSGIELTLKATNYSLRKLSLPVRFDIDFDSRILPESVLQNNKFSAKYEDYTVNGEVKFANLFFDRRIDVAGEIRQKKGWKLPYSAYIDLNSDPVVNIDLDQRIRFHSAFAQNITEASLVVDNYSMNKFGLPYKLTADFLTRMDSDKPEQEIESFVSVGGLQYRGTIGFRSDSPLSSIEIGGNAGIEGVYMPPIEAEVCVDNQNGITLKALYDKMIALNVLKTNDFLGLELKTSNYSLDKLQIPANLDVSIDTKMLKDRIVQTNSFAFRMQDFSFSSRLDVSLSNLFKVAMDGRLLVKDLLSAPVVGQIRIEKNNALSGNWKIDNDLDLAVSLSNNFADLKVQTTDLDLEKYHLAAGKLSLTFQTLLNLSNMQQTNRTKVRWNGIDFDGSLTLTPLNDDQLFIADGSVNLLKRFTLPLNARVRMMKSGNYTGYLRLDNDMYLALNYTNKTYEFNFNVTDYPLKKYNLDGAINAKVYTKFNENSTRQNIETYFSWSALTYRGNIQSIQSDQTSQFLLSGWATLGNDTVLPVNGEFFSIKNSDYNKLSLRFDDNIQLDVQTTNQAMDFSLSSTNYALTKFNVPANLDMELNFRTVENLLESFTLDTTVSVSNNRWRLHTEAFQPEEERISINLLSISQNADSLVSTEGYLWLQENKFDGQISFGNKGDIEFMGSENDINLSVDLTNIFIRDFLKKNLDVLASMNIQVSGSAAAPKLNGSLRMVNTLDSEQFLLEAQSISNNGGEFRFNGFHLMSKDYEADLNGELKTEKEGFQAKMQGYLSAFKLIHGNMDLSYIDRENNRSLSYRLQNLKLGEITIDELDGEAIYKDDKLIFYTSENKNGLDGFFVNREKQKSWNVNLVLDKIQAKFNGAIEDNSINAKLSALIDARFFSLVSMFSKVEGILSCEADITGDATSPSINGKVILSNFAANLMYVDTDFRKQTLEIPIIAGKMILDNLPMLTTTGDFNLYGYIDVSSLPSVYLELLGTPLNPTRDSIIKLDVDIPLMTLKGEIVVKSVGLSGTMDKLTFSANGIAQNALVRVAITGWGEGGEMSPFLKNLVWNIHLEAGPGVQFMNEFIETVALPGQSFSILNCLGDGTFTLKGDLKVNRGTIPYLGNSFTIRDGVVVFSGDPGDVIPYIRAESTMRQKDSYGDNIDFYLTFEGKLTKINLKDVYSIPDLPKSELMALLGFKPMAITSTNNQAMDISKLFVVGTAPLTSMAESFVWTPFSQSIRRTFGLDLVTIRTSIFEQLALNYGKEDVFASTLQNTSISLGKYILPNLLLGGEISLYKSDLSTIGLMPLLTFSVDYEFGNVFNLGYLSVGYRVAPVFDSGFDLRHNVEFSFHTRF